MQDRLMKQGFFRVIRLPQDVTTSQCDSNDSCNSRITLVHGAAAAQELSKPKIEN